VIVLQVLVAILIFAVVMRVGLWLMRVIASDPPPPPPRGEMRRVDVRYRCSVCGTEMKVTLAPEEEPEPPRHCMEEMALIPQ